MLNYYCCYYSKSIKQNKKKKNVLNSRVIRNIENCGSELGVSASLMLVHIEYRPLVCYICLNR